MVYGKGSNFSFQFASSFEFLDLFSGYVEPIFLVRENASPGMLTGGVPGTVGSLDSNEVDLLTGYVKFSPFDSWEIEVGRDSVVVGPGLRRHASAYRQCPAARHDKALGPHRHNFAMVF